MFNPVLMITAFITAAIGAAVTTGVCLWAYRKGKADGAAEAYREKSNMSSDLMGLMAVCTMAGFGKGFTPSYTPSYTPKDDELDKFINTLKVGELEKLIDALKDNNTSCPCKQQEESSQS